MKIQNIKSSTHQKGFKGKLVKVNIETAIDSDLIAKVTRNALDPKHFTLFEKTHNPKKEGTTFIELLSFKSKLTLEQILTKINIAKSSNNSNQKNGLIDLTDI